MWLSNADNTAALAQNWASATPLEWRTSDAAAIAARDAVTEAGAPANWFEKVQDPKYTVEQDDLGTYVPPTGGAIVNIVPTPNPLTVTQAGAANASCGTVAATGGNLPITWSITPTANWAMSGSTVQKKNAGTAGYTLGNNSVTIKATGSDGEAYTKTMNINCT
jgi:hypothetical protein